MPVNEYEHLLVRNYYTDGGDMRDYNSLRVYNDRTESVIVLTAEVAGKWAVGYQLLFANGRHAERLPNLEYGYCRSEREALLWFLGYCKMWKQYFTADTMQAIEHKMHDLAQSSLFT